MGASLSREARGVLAAAREGDADAVAAAFAANPHAAERSATFWKRLSALHLAAAQGHSDVIRAVMAPLVAGVRAEVAAGAYPGPFTCRLRRSVNSRDLFHRTPLLLAAKRGHVNAARALVESAANVFAQDRDANTSLHYAALHGHGDVISYLLQRAEARGVLHRLVNRRNVSGFTALHFAVWGRHPDAALALLLAGADPHAANDRVFDSWLPVPIGCTPLHLAVMRHSMDLVWLLLEHYASQEVGRLPGTPAPLDPRLATNLYGLNPAQMAAHIGFRPAVRVLLPHVPVQALFQSRDVEALRVQGARSLKALAGAALARRLRGELDALEAALKRQDEESAAARARAAEAAVVVVASSGGGGKEAVAVAGSSKRSKAAAGDNDDEGGGDGDDDAAAFNGGAGAGLFGGDSSDVDDEDDEPRDQDAAAAISPGRRLRRRLDQPVPPSCCSRCGRAGGGVVVLAAPPAASPRPTPSCPSHPPLPPGHYRRSASDGAAFSQQQQQQATAPRRLCAECLAAPAGVRRRRARLSEPSDGGVADEAAVAAAVAAATAAAPRVGGTLVRSLTPPASLMQMHQHASARLRLARRWPSSQGLGGGGGGDASDAPAAAAAAAAAADPAAPAPAPAAASACCHDSEYDGWDNDNTCGLCFDALPRVAVAGCGHASCVPCARRLSEVPGGRVPLCPFCRQPIRYWELHPPPVAAAADQAQAQAAASVPLPSSSPVPSPPAAAAQRARQEEQEIEQDDAVTAAGLGGQPLAVAVAAVAASAALPPLTVA